MTFSESSKRIEEHWQKSFRKLQDVESSEGSLGTWFFVLLEWKVCPCEFSMLRHASIVALY